MEKYSILWNDEVINKRHKFGADARKIIYLPMKIEKVMIPTVPDIPMNYFELLILKLLEIKPMSEKKVASILQLDEKFVQKIFERIIEKKFVLAEDLSITEDGRGEINGYKRETETQAAYIFYDLLGKFYWDIVMPESEYQEYNKKPFVIEGITRIGRVNARIGKEGTSKSMPIYYLPAKDVKNEAASKKEVENIIEGFKKLMNYTKKMGIEIPKNYVKFNPRVSKNVDVLESSEIVYVGTQIFIPENLEEKNEWQILHPFNFGEADYYKHKMYLNLDFEQSEIFNGWIKEMYVNIADNIKIDMSYEISKLYMTEVFSKEILEPQYERVRSLIYKALENYYQIYTFSDEGTEYHQKQIYLKTFLINIVACLEQAFIYALENTEKDFNENMENTKESLDVIITSSANAIGFEVPANSTMFFISLTDLKNKQGLIPLLAKNIFLKSDGIKEIAKWKKDFPTFIEHINNLRNESGHDSEIELDSEEITGYFNIFLHCIGDLLGMNYEAIDYGSNLVMLESIDIEEEKKKKNELYNVVLGRIKLKNYSKSIVESLIKVEMYLECKKRKLKYFTESDAAVAMGIIYEIILSQIKNEVFDSDASKFVEDDTRENYLILRTVIKDYNFELDEESFEKKLLTVPTFKIRKSFDNFDKSVISTKLYTLLFSLYKKTKNNFVQQIAAKVPDFIDLAIEIDRVRGHGDIDENPDEIERLASRLKEMLNDFNQIKR